MAAAAAAADEAPRGVANAAGISAAVVQRGAALLTEASGLTFPSGRRTALRRALARLMSESASPSGDALLELLASEPALVTRLIGLVRIGETYFFRHPEQLQAIGRHILPTLARTAAADRPTINIWSAGCSTGEEAYSLAIIAAETFGAGSGSAVRIAATDIDPGALRAAASGTYGRWSFRTPIGDRARWFEHDGRHTRVVPSVVDVVTFSRDNLTLDTAGLPPGLDGPPGLIVCRNVTMYLSADARRRVAARFLRLLAPGGWLVVAPVELSSDLYPGLETVRFDGMTAYRRPLRGGTRRRPSTTTADRPVVVPPHTEPRAPRLASRPAPRTAARSSLPTRSAVVGDRLVDVRVLADQGRLDDAWRLVVTAVRERPDDRHGHLLQASIAEARNDLAEASAALRRVLYLDRSDAVALFRLGLLEWRLGSSRAAMTRLGHAVRLVDGLDADMVLDAASELTVARLRTTAAVLGHG